MQLLMPHLGVQKWPYSWRKLIATVFFRLFQIHNLFYCTSVKCVEGGKRCCRRWTQTWLRNRAQLISEAAGWNVRRRTVINAPFEICVRRQPLKERTQPKTSFYIDTFILVFCFSVFVFYSWMSVIRFLCWRTLIGHYCMATLIDDMKRLLTAHNVPGRQQVTLNIRAMTNVGPYCLCYSSILMTLPTQMNPISNMNSSVTSVKSCLQLNSTLDYSNNSLCAV